MQQTIRVANAPIHSKVNIPGSKSITFRALLLAALADGVSEITGMQASEDVRTFINALYQLGIVSQLDEKNGSCIIAGGTGRLPKKQATIWCGNVFAVARFLLVACAATPGVYYLDGSPRLREKPISSLLTILCRQGAQIIPNDVHNLPFTLVGADSLEGGEIIFDREINSQAISALLMIAPYARSAFNFTLPDLNNHEFIDMTSTMMAEFGVLVHRIHQGQWMIPVPQRYQARDYTVEPDFNLAAYFFAAAAVTSGEVTIQPIKRSQSKQAAVNILALLEKMGCRVVETHAGLTVKGPAELTGIEISMRHYSDAFFIVAALAPFAKSATTINHVGVMRKKELKFIEPMINQLTKLGVQIETGKDWIKILPSTVKSGTISSAVDYRIALAFAIIGLKVPGIAIQDIEAVNKAFPDFFNLWHGLTEAINISA